MPTAATKPLKPTTPAQIKALHAIGKRRGLTHEQLRDLAGVESLKLLSVVDASKLLDRLQCDDHKVNWQPGPPDRATARHMIRLATERQRNYIAVLFAELGWSEPKAAGWLRERHGIRDLATGVFSSAAAKQVVLELQAIQRKQKPAPDRGDEPA